MYNSPRRPYFNRSQNMPQTTTPDDAVSMDHRRFWKLLDGLRRRQEDARKDDKAQQSTEAKR
ncbi:MAG: hypothetical protein ACFE0Q_02290 [Anaerolineae bacterium]